MLTVGAGQGLGRSTNGATMRDSATEARGLRRKRPADAPLELEAAYDLALAAARVATFEYDLETGPVWSARLTSVLPGRSPEEMLPALLEPVLAVLQAPGGWQDYMLEQQVDDRWLRIHVRPGPAGRFTGALVDITEQHEYHQALDDLVDRYRLLVELSPDGIVVHHQGRIVYANPAARRFVGARDDGDIIGRMISAFVHPDSQAAMMARISGLSTPGMVSEPAEALLVRPDGGTLAVASTSVRTTWEGAPAFQVILRDVSERAAAEHALRYQAALIGHVSDGIIAVDEVGTITSWNPAAETIYGWSAADALGRPLADLLDTSTPADGARVEVVHRRRDGSEVDVALSVARLVDSHDAAVGSVIVCSDITERKRAAAALWHESRHDALTGLANRTLVLERLDQALEDAGAGDLAVAVVLLDLDHFKVVNDSLGHGAGDEVLRLVGERLSLCVGEGDTVARLGGDEFVVVAKGAAARDAGVPLADRMRAAVDEPLHLGDRRIVVASSAGIVVVAEPGALSGNVLRDADVAMYQAKARGRGRHETFDAALRSRAVRRLELEEHLRAALHSEELWLAFQPLVSLSSGQVIGTEALLRWTSPTFGTVTPGEFIPIAEESGLVVPLGERVLHLACTQTARWRARHPQLASLRVSVNISARQLSDPALVQTVSAALARSGLPATALKLEITESMLMADAKAAAVTLRSLADLGLALSIDDFGTGYSSLAYLTRFAVHELKIDRSFVDGMSRDPNDAAIVASVVALAHTLGLDVVAEGVETPAQLEILRDLGCDAAQGYYLSRPAGGADILPALLRESLIA